uniref:Major facilitator superfamily (MFS) profile domain-containing protein n=1 Tax=Oryza nivara TaxID=4536 RepID=A0A0E0I3F0_ORYNI
MDEAAAGQRASPLLAKNDGSSYGEESQSLLEEQEPQGTVFITVGAFLPSAPALCNTESCSSMNGTQHLVYFSGLYLTAIGCGGVRSALLPLGADQFNNDSSLDIQKRRNFFSLFYICVIFGVITSGTIVVWIQENVSWAIGYGVATACIALALIGFLVGTPIFRRHEPHGSPVRSVVQVIVASFRNLALELPADSSLLYEVRRKNTQKSEPKLAHTDDFRFLDKAAIMSDLSLDQDSCTSPWRICTVTQVEELKILIRLLPVWATGIFFCVGISQMHTTFIQQGTVMNTKIGSLSIPAASLYSFEVICVTFWVFLVNKVIIPVNRACFANGAEMTQLQRIGIGRFLMIFAMAIAAFLEMKRLESVQGGDQPLSIAWQLPQYFVIAGAECFTIITQLEFFHGQAPDSMKSMLTAFALLTTALGNYFSSAIITLIARVTGTWHSPGWIPDDLNKGHLDYYYWCLAAISAVNFVVYIYFASKYKLKKAVIQV